MKKIMGSLCDDDSTSAEDVRHSSNISAMDSRKTGSTDPTSAKSSTKKSQRKCSSSSETNYSSANEETKEKWMSNKQDKHESNMKNKTTFCNNVRRKNYKTKESKFNDLEEGKHSEKRQKKYSISKSNRKDFVSLNTEDADSSSGKEFQKSTFSRHNNLLKKVAEAKKNDESDSSFIKHTEEKIMISKKQSLCFKSRVMKVFNKFKEVCSDYELRMEHIKWKHLKKELVFQESANNIVKKSKSLINELKMELDMQEKELVNFYKEWSQNCSIQNTDHEDSSSSENEVLENKNKKIPDKSKTNSKEGSIVSEYDNKEIFSDTETIATKINEEKNEENENSQAFEIQRSTDDDNDENMPRVTSPILGSKTEKEISNKIHTKDISKIVLNEKVSKESHNNENKQVINDSLDDIFEESITNNVSASELVKNKSSLLNDCLTQVNNSDSQDSDKTVALDDSTEGSKNSLINKAEITATVPTDAQKKLEPTKKANDNVLPEVDSDEQAKKVLLESDQKTPAKEECPIKKSSTESLTNNSNEKDKSKCKEIKSNSKQDNKVQNNSTSNETSSDEQVEITDIENCVKRTLLDSNSDDSMDHSSDKKMSDDKEDELDDNSDDMHAKAKLLISSNSESSSLSSDSDDNVQSTKLNTSLKKNNKRAKGSVTDTTDFDESVGVRVKKRRYLIKAEHKADKKLNMACRVALEKLPKSILRKHAKALQKSQQYMECKRIKSLINVDRLQQNQGKSSGSGQSLSKKKSAAKETKDSLLDHLEKVKNGEFIEDAEKNTNSDNSSSEVLLPRATIQTNDQLMLDADKATKNMLLNSSDSDIEHEKIALEEHESDEEKDNIKLKDKSRRLSATKTEKKDDTEEDEEKRKKNKWRRNKILTMKLSSESDSDVEREKWNKNQEKQREKKEENEKGSNIENTIVTRKRKNRRKIVDSDSDTVAMNSDSNSDSSVVLEENLSSDSNTSTKKQQKKTRKRKTRKSSDTDSSFAEKRTKPKRKRIKNVSTDSDENADDPISNSQGTPGKKSRKNIRKVMKDKQVADDTKQAAKEEEERLKRIAERQKLYNEMYETRLANEEKVDKLVLDFDPETKEELLSVHEELVKRLKPHQAKGVKFMWDACFESIERMKSSPGSGCIIAHCMGLGKTLQVIALTHTLLVHDELGIKTVMIVCPLSTVLNWRNEFNLWLKNVDHDIEVYELTKLKQNTDRRYMLENWKRTGGVLIIGYEMFRNLSATNNRMRKNVKESILKCLIDPGPDIIVCDEGHLLKNEDTALSKSMNRIKTLRRIILTGTPLQNNLIEYHCMVQFIKPNLLGTKKEFLNRFANPITNGQFDDSTEYDVKLMKKRAYVLHKMLKGCVQRFDYTVLMPFLPPKQEYVIFVSLTETQINLYQHYLDNFARQKRAAGGFLFADFQALQRIWTHPLVLQLNAEKIEKLNGRRFTSDSEGSLRSFIDDNSDTSTASSTSDDDDDDVQAIESDVPTKSTRQNKIECEINSKVEEAEAKEETWWSQFVQSEHFEDMRVSSKLLLLFGILKECEQIGDKILVFSQSLYSLTLIERFLEKIDNETQNGTSSECIDGHTGSWSLGLDYFRLDGQTSPENRNTWCKIFNQPSNTRARLFLISTRAGGLGINLTAANRVIIFDASWNPSHDVQSIFRVYRFGQKKPCYVYRFLAAGTMEEKIYNRQVTKLSLSCRVVDVQQIERHYSNNDLSELYKFEPNPNNGEKTLNLPKDRLLAEIFLKYKKCVENYHEHDSLLENKAEEELNEEERKQAWLEYEEEKKGKQMLPPQTMTVYPNGVMMNQLNSTPSLDLTTDYEKLQELIRKDYPNATPEYQQMVTARVLADMYNYWEQQTYNTNKRLLEQQNLSTKPPILRTQMMNVAQTSYGLHNANVKPANPVIPVIPANPANTDNDIIEIISTTTNKTSKSKEE